MITGAHPDLAPLLVPCAQLTLDPANARRHPERNRAAVQASLRTYGQRKPIVVRRQGMVVEAGNGTLDAARALGWTHIAALLVDDDPVTATGYAIADNRTAELAEWDQDILASLLSTLASEDVEVSALGFSDDEMRALLDATSPRPAPELRPEAPAPEQAEGPPQSVLGEVYELGPHRLLCGDSTDPGQRARLLDGREFGVTILDPPYEMPEKTWTRLLGDPCVLFGQAKHLRAVPERLWRFERVINKGVMRRSATVQIGHMHAFVAQLGTVKTLPQVPTTFPSVVEREDADAEDSRYGKPVALLVEHLTHWTPLWDLVFDPFAGGGSSFIAAAEMGRVCFGVELDPATCDIIRRRWGAWARAAGRDPGPGAL